MDAQEVVAVFFRGRAPVPKLFFLIAGLLLAVCASAQTVRAPVRMLAGFPPGGNVDILARMFAGQLADAAGRPVIVDNRPGAVGQIAAEALKASAPDGNTLMLTTHASVVIRPLTMKRPPFDPLADFVPVAPTGSFATALGVHAGIPVNNLRELAAWARANPGSAGFGSAGAGGSTHFFGLMLAQALGVELRHVPYKGSGPAVTDVVAGHIPATVQPLGTMLTQSRAGKLRILAVSSRKRSPTAPAVPTFTELGYPSLEMEGWFGIFAPAGTPQEIITRLNATFVQAMRVPAFRDKMRGLDLEVQEMKAAEYASVVKADYERWRAIIKASGFSAESE